MYVASLPCGQLSSFWFYVLPPLIDPEHVGESTMRSRSILFLALGTLVGSALGLGTGLVVPENGLISLNVPLTFGRGGSHSTRTTHPHTIALYRRLSRFTRHRFPRCQPAVSVPTKGEMLGQTLCNPRPPTSESTNQCHARIPFPGVIVDCHPAIVATAYLASFGERLFTLLRLDDEPVQVDVTDSAQRSRWRQGSRQDVHSRWRSRRLRRMTHSSALPRFRTPGRSLPMTSRIRSLSTGAAWRRLSVSHLGTSA